MVRAFVLAALMRCVSQIYEVWMIYLGVCKYNVEGKVKGIKWKRRELCMNLFTDVVWHCIVWFVIYHMSVFLFL